MKYAKLFGLLAVTAVALMALVSTASATLTSPSGTQYGGELVGSSSNMSLDGSVKIACSASSIKGTPSSAGATSGSVSSLSFTECGKDTVSVLKTGSMSVASNGAVTSSGAEVTVQIHRTILGFPITTHCIYATNSSGVGSLTEGVAPAVVHVGSSPIAEVATDGACGNDAVLTGSYSGSGSAIVVD